MNPTLSVAELIALLQKCPQDMPVATFANNHTFNGWPGERMRVVVGNGFVTIGNLSRWNFSDLDPTASALPGEVLP